MIEVISQRSRLWHFNAHALLSNGEAAVFDPGIFQDELTRFRDTIAERGFRVRYLVLTHSHHDHIRGWKFFPGAEIVSHRKVAEKDEVAKQRILTAKDMLDKKFGTTDPDFSFPPIHRVYDSQETLRVGDAVLSLRYLPGHSDCISMTICPQAKAAFTGDYFVSPGMPYVRWRVDKFREAMKTFREWVAQDQIENIYPAHNDSIHGKAAVLQAIDREEDYFARLSEIVRELAKTEKSEEEIIKETAKRLRPEKMWDQDRDNARRALRELREV